MKNRFVKKMFSLMAVSVLALSLSMTAFAADTEINQNTSDPKSGETAVSYEVSPTYTVIIPEKVTIGSSVTVSASSVVVDEGKEVNVKITATSASNQEDFTIASSNGVGADTLEYTVTDDTLTTYTLGNTVLSVDPANGTSGSVTLTFALADGETPSYSGTYSGTMTFTVSVDAVSTGN